MLNRSTPRRLRRSYSQLCCWFLCSRGSEWRDGLRRAATECRPPPAPALTSARGSAHTPSCNAPAAPSSMNGSRHGFPISPRCTHRRLSRPSLRCVKTVTPPSPHLPSGRTAVQPRLAESLLPQHRRVARPLAACAIALPRLRRAVAAPLPENHLRRLSRSSNAQRRHPRQPLHCPVAASRRCRAIAARDADRFGQRRTSNLS